MYDFTKNDYAILRVVNRKKATSELMSISISTLQEETKLSSGKIRKTLGLFMKEGYIAYGIRKVNAKTFYILPKGVEKLKDLIGGDEQC